MKTIEQAQIKADPVISELRRAKVALGQKYNFDVIAMVRGLRERDQQENANKAVDSTATRITPPAEQEARNGPP